MAWFYKYVYYGSERIVDSQQKDESAPLIQEDDGDDVVDESDDIKKNESKM